MKRNGDQGGAASSKTKNECKAPGTWGIYLDWIKVAFRALRLSPQGAGLWAGGLWMFIGVLVGFTGILQFSFFPFNVLIAMFGFFVIAPLGYAHMEKIAAGADC